nr:MAG TPA: hypothetical protein [Caudoviricetes sp.]
MTGRKLMYIQHISVSKYQYIAQFSIICIRTDFTYKPVKNI